MVFCGVEVHAASRELPVGDWIFAADAGTAGAGWATHFQFRASWGAGGRANSTSSQGHLVNRLSGGCVNWRPGGQVRGHSSGSPRTTAAPPSATTELSASAGLRTLLFSPGASSRSDRCTPPPVASFDFVRSRSSLRVGSDGVVGAGTDCAGSRCLFQLIPAGTTDGGAPADWFHLRSVATGHLVRLAHSSMPSQASWGGASPPLATLKTSAQVRAAKEAASGVCPLSGGGPAGWRYNASLWSPLVRAALAPWAEGGVSPTALDLAFSPAMYPGPAAHGLPGLHVSIRDGRVYVKTNSEYRMPLMLDMLRTVSRRVRLPDVEFVAHLWDHPKVRREQPLLVLAHYVDEAHRDVAMPAPWSWDERAHAWPQPFTKLRGGCPTPWTQRKPVLYFRGGCNGPTRGWRGPLWRFYPRKYANVLTKRLGGRVDAGTYDHCDSPKLNKHEWGWDEQMEKEMRADGPKRKVDPFSANCQYRCGGLKERGATG